MRKLGRSVTALAYITALLAAFAATRAYAADIGYLASPGVAANEFPSPQRPVARIVSPRRAAEERRDALNEAGQIARALELKPGMTVGDIGAGSGYHTVRLSHLVGPAGSVVAQDVTRDYLIELARRTERLKLTNVQFAPRRTTRPASARFLAGCCNPRAHVSRDSPTLCLPLQSRGRSKAGCAGRNCRS